MVKQRAFLLFFMAIGIGLAATWMANRWIQNRISPTEVAEASAQPMVVAALEIPFGQQIATEHLKTIAWPIEERPNGAFTDVNEVVGKVANRKIIQNEMILDDRVVDKLDGSVLAAIVGPNMRAVTVRVNDVIGVAGFLLPGNRVDVIASRKDNDRRAETDTILENLKVLAVDQQAATDKEQPGVVRAVTLEVNPEQAERLVKATEEGNVQLVLRNPKDDSRITRKEEPKPEVIPEPPKQKVTEGPPVKRFATITVIRGTAVQQAKAKL
jgi:pilus assembly protein CpaB